MMRLSRPFKIKNPDSGYRPWSSVSREKDGLALALEGRFMSRPPILSRGPATGQVVELNLPYNRALVFGLPGWRVVGLTQGPIAPTFVTLYSVEGGKDKIEAFGYIIAGQHWGATSIVQLTHMFGSVRPGLYVDYVSSTRVPSPSMLGAGAVAPLRDTAGRLLMEGGAESVSWIVPMAGFTRKSSVRLTREDRFTVYDQKLNSRKGKIEPWLWTAGSPAIFSYMEGELLDNDGVYPTAPLMPIECDDYLVLQHNENAAASSAPRTFEYGRVVGFAAFMDVVGLVDACLGDCVGIYKGGDFISVGVVCSVWEGPEDKEHGPCTAQNEYWGFRPCRVMVTHNHNLRSIEFGRVSSSLYTFQCQSSMHEQDSNNVRKDL